MIDPRNTSEIEKLVSIAQKGFDFLYLYVGDDGDDSQSQEDPYENFFLKGVNWSRDESSWAVSFSNHSCEEIHVFLKEEEKVPNCYRYYSYSFDFDYD